MYYTIRSIHCRPDAFIVSHSLRITNGAYKNDFILLMRKHLYPVSDVKKAHASMECGVEINCRTNYVRESYSEPGTSKASVCDIYYVLGFR